MKGHPVTAALPKSLLLQALSDLTVFASPKSETTQFGSQRGERNKPTRGLWSQCGIEVMAGSQSLREVVRTRQTGQSVYLKCHSRRLHCRQVARVPKQPEARHVSARLRAMFAHQPRRYYEQNVV